MIKSKKELDFYIKADLMMRSGFFTRSLKQWAKELILPDYVFRYIVASRKYVYYSHRGGLNCIRTVIYAAIRHRLGIKLGFSIAFEEIGYGLHIPHHGTIVVGNGNQIGNYSVLHTSTCITAGKKVIGTGFYLSTGAKVIKDISIGDYVSVGANSLVNCDCPAYSMVAGNPARKIKDSTEWYIRDSKEYARRVLECEKLKQQYRL